MNRKRVIIGVTMALIFVFTAFSPAISNNTNIASSVPEIASISNSINKIPVFNIKPAGKAYDFNNNGVTFSGNDPYIKLNNQYYPSQWIISNNTNSQKLNIIDNKKIVSKFQNSAVEILKDKSIKVAYIYLFYNNSVHADITIKNLKNTTGNYTVQFNLMLPSSNIMENNHNINNEFSNVYANNKYINLINIKNPYNSLSFNNVMINPSASFPLHTTIMKDNSYAVLNMAYNVILTKNETYTIDPVIETYGGSNVVTYGTITTGISTGACLFNSNGKEIGVITETAQTGSTLYADSTKAYVEIDTTFSPTSSSYDVNCIEQKIVDSNGGNSNFVERNYYSVLQYHEEQSCPKIQSAINAAFFFLNSILAIEGISIPNPSSLFSSSSDVSAGDVTNGYQITANAGTTTSAKAGVYWNPITLSYWTYLYGFIPEYHTYDVHEFGDCLEFHFQQPYGTHTNPYADPMTYTSTFTITNSDMKPVEFENQQYKAQISENFDLEQYSST